MTRHCHGCNRLASVADLHIVWRGTISALLCDDCIKRIFEVDGITYEEVGR